MEKKHGTERTAFTRGGKQDRIKLHDLAGRTLYAPADFKKESGAEKLRPLYVPYKLYSLTLEGDADLYGQSSYLDGVNKTTREEKVSFGIQGRFENVAFDVSAGFDDTLAEQIVPFEMDHSRDFDPVYLAGSYANIPDVDDNIYKEKTLEVAAQKTLDAMHESFERKAVTLADYPDGSSVSEHLPVKEMTDYTAFFPVWFLSFRKGNRIAYAAATVSEPASRVLHGAFRACSPKGPAFRSLRF